MEADMNESMHQLIKFIKRANQLQNYDCFNTTHNSLIITVQASNLSFGMVIKSLFWYHNYNMFTSNAKNEDDRKKLVI